MCDAIYIPLQERNNYHVASMNLSVIISISHDVTEEVHRCIKYVKYNILRIYNFTCACTCLCIYRHICTHINNYTSTPKKYPLAIT